MTTMNIPTLEQCAYMAPFETARSSTDTSTLTTLPASPSSVLPPMFLYYVSAPSHSSFTSPYPHVESFLGYSSFSQPVRRRSAVVESHTRTRLHPRGGKSFTCPVRSCPKSFTTSGNLSRHKRTQHAWLDTPLECLVADCHCQFASEAKLARHMAMVHFSASRHSHACPAPQCGCAFSSAGNLRRHMNQHHHQLQIDQNKNKNKNETKTNRSLLLVAQSGPFEPIDAATDWSLHCGSTSRGARATGTGSNCGSSSVDDELLAVLAWFLDE